MNILDARDKKKLQKTYDNFIENSGMEELNEDLYFNFLRPDIIFEECLKEKYIHVENDGDYVLRWYADGKDLYIYFQWSHSTMDWFSNLDFPAKTYKDTATSWKAHRGFLRVWKTIREYIKDAILDEKIKNICICGYSHGAAIAFLAHEYVWFNRPDLREGHLASYVFGCPRVFYGRPHNNIEERWKNFYMFRNCNDIVTHAPPRVFGFRHLGNMIWIGDNKKLKKHQKLNCINAHYDDNYMNSLKDFYQNLIAIKKMPIWYYEGGYNDRD